MIICLVFEILKLVFEGNIFSLEAINLFISNDAISNRDALWPIQGKKHYLQAAIVEEYTIQEKYCDERFLNYNGDMSINFLSILCQQFARMV